MGDDTVSHQPSTIKHTENDLFNLNLDTQTSLPTPMKTSDLLGVDFNSMPLDKPILHRNASETVLPAPMQATTFLKTETKSSSNQNINHLDPFKDLFSSSSTTTATTQKTSSNESLAAKQASGTRCRTCTVFLLIHRIVSVPFDSIYKKMK
jgi:hypothetical protein